jgi:hypothetical protein
VADAHMPGLVRVPLVEEAGVRIFAVRKKGRVLSGFAEHAIQRFTRELTNAAEGRYG